MRPLSRLTKIPTGSRSFMPCASFGASSTSTGCLMPGVTLDAGGLIALDRDDRRMVVLLSRARETGARVTVPASVLAQAIRRPDRQDPLVGLLRAPPPPARWDPTENPGARPPESPPNA